MWIADLGDGNVGFTTEAHTWKVKRVRHTPAVELAPSDGRGRVSDGAPAITGIARVVTDADADLSQLESALRAKYGLPFGLYRAYVKLRKRIGAGEGYVGIVIALD